MTHKETKKMTYRLIEQEYMDGLQWFSHVFHILIVLSQPEEWDGQHRNNMKSIRSGKWAGFVLPATADSAERYASRVVTWTKGYYENIPKEERKFADSMLSHCEFVCEAVVWLKSYIQTQSIEGIAEFLKKWNSASIQT